MAGETCGHLMFVTERGVGIRAVRFFFEACTIPPLATHFSSLCLPGTFNTNREESVSIIAS